MAAKKKLKQRRGLKGTPEQHFAKATESIETADLWLERAKERRGADRLNAALESAFFAAEATAECAWTKTDQQDKCYMKAIARYDEAVQIIRKKR